MLGHLWRSPILWAPAEGEDSGCHARSRQGDRLWDRRDPIVPREAVMGSP